MILGVLGISGIFFYVGKINTGRSYIEYTQLFEYRRLHPELLPSPMSIKLTDAGHTNVVADMSWIQLIQYIGDNIGNEKYIIYTETLIQYIVTLHPHFTRAYNLGLILTPNFDPDSPRYRQGNEKKWTLYLSLADRGIRENCDAQKIAIILSTPEYESLWKNESLKNPCSDGYIAYNAGFLASTLKDNKKAEKYYLIASMHDDAPQAAKVLTILMRAKSGDYLSAAEKFLLVAVNGYDEAPYVCQNAAKDILMMLKNNTNPSLNEPLISELDTIAKNLPEFKDSNNPLINSTTNCHDSLLRGIKQLYLLYITERAQSYPDIMTGSVLVSRKIIPKVPTIPEQHGYNVFRKKDGTWNYRLIH